MRGAQHDDHQQYQKLRDTYSTNHFVTPLSIQYTQFNPNGRVWLYKQVSEISLEITPAQEKHPGQHQNQHCRNAADEIQGWYWLIISIEFNLQVVKIDLEDLEEVLGVPLGHADGAETSETLGGLIYEAAGKVPDPGDGIEVGGYLITVEKVADQRIVRVLLEADVPLPGHARQREV